MVSNNSRKSYAMEIFNINPDISKKPRSIPSSIITFSDALVIIAKVGTNSVKNILIDNGNSADILYHHAFSRMDIGDRKLENIYTPLYGFTRNEVRVVGTIDLLVLFGTLSFQTWKMVKLHVISASSSYNDILGRTTIASLKAITSILYLNMKFPTDFGIGEVSGDQVVDRQCYLSTVIPKKIN